MFGLAWESDLELSAHLVRELTDSLAKQIKETEKFVHLCTLQDNFIKEFYKQIEESLADPNMNMVREYTPGELLLVIQTLRSTDNPVHDECRKTLHSSISTLISWIKQNREKECLDSELESLLGGSSTLSL